MRAVRGAIAVAAAVVVAGCSSTVPTQGASPLLEPVDDPVTAAVALLDDRYQLVRDGDFVGACALYSSGFVDLLAELAEADPLDCVGVHEAAAANATEYLAAAQDQDRLGITPFFYVPSAIDIDATFITSDGATSAIVEPGAVVSLDDREFEDGVGVTPGWLAGLVYVALDDDGQWRFVAPGER